MANIGTCENLLGAIKTWAAKFADKPTQSTLSLPTASWTGSASPYAQVVSITGGTAKSKIDIQLESVAAQQLATDEVNYMYVANDNGVFTVYAVGAKPSADITVNYTRVELA